MRVITIGRNRGNDVIVEDAAASRYHLQIVEFDDGSYHLIDFNSTNGTYVNGNRVFGETKLEKSDFVRIGDTMLPWKTYFSSDFISQAEENFEESPVVTGEHEAKKGDTNIFAILGFVFAFVFSLLGLVFSIVGLSKANKMGGKQKGLAIAGLIISIISIVIIIIYFVVIAGTIGAVGGAFGSY
ncbi:MAG: FHA domain-containing protein [Bacteroidales bacterium]|nr:FHA domain-containing protein [Bacteroidales bacterium]